MRDFVRGHGLPLLIAAALAPDALAQQAVDPPVYIPTSLAVDANVPRTPSGRPDLQNVVWAVNFFPVFEASPLADTLVVSEAKASEMVAMMVGGMSQNEFYEIDPEAHVILGETDGLPIVRGERRTRMVVRPADGVLPVTKAVRAEIMAFDGLDPPEKDGPEQRPLGERCLAQNPPPVSSPISYTRMRFVQTPGFLVMHGEAGDEARIIPMADEPAPGPSPSVLGDSSARWEGDTLVIETINLPREARIRAIPTIVVEPDARVIERLTRISETELLFQFTVEDNDVYTAPWLGEYSLFATDTPMFPSPCHEGNYSLPNILKAARVAEGNY